MDDSSNRSARNARPQRPIDAASTVHSGRIGLQARSTASPSRRRSASRYRSLTFGVASAAIVFLAAAIIWLNSDRPPQHDVQPAESPYLVDLSVTPEDGPLRNFERPRFEVAAIDAPTPAPNLPFEFPESQISDANDRFAVAPFRWDRAENEPDPLGIAKREFQLKRELSAKAFRTGYVEGSTFSKRLVPPRDGSNRASRRAIDDALRWLVAHQANDGGWSFHHRIDAVCDRGCSNPGSMRERSAATALALLALIRAGHAGVDSDHFAHVQKGLAYLLVMQRPTARGGAIWGDGSANARPCAHALGTIAVCEAHKAAAILRERFENADRVELRRLSQLAKNAIPSDKFRWSAIAAINAIAASQHAAGGWRYDYRMPGDTSVTAWMIAALRSGQASGIEVRGDVVLRANRFLDTAIAENGRPLFYYLPNERQPSIETTATTAMGWWCRLATGSSPDNPSVTSGIRQLAKWGPSIGDDANLYFNYHATQVLHLAGGTEWDAWFPPLRDYLAATQVRDSRSHAFGSWYVATDPGSRPGGRLYCTAMAALTLLVVSSP